MGKVFTAIEIAIYACVIAATVKAVMDAFRDERTQEEQEAGETKRRLQVMRDVEARNEERIRRWEDEHDGEY